MIVRRSFNANVLSVQPQKPSQAESTIPAFLRDCLGLWFYRKRGEKGVWKAREEL